MAEHFAQCMARIGVRIKVATCTWPEYLSRLKQKKIQIIGAAWGADYPDPENFLFLLHGAQSRVKNQGENTSNYVNPEFDALFERVKNIPSSAERQRLIDRMIDIARRDAPWLWGYHPKSYGLSHAWMQNGKPNNMARNNLKYLRVDVERREAMRREWNRPVVWPFILITLALIVSAVPAFLAYRRRERMAARPA
jgi:ABC-type oligopeptide transport system substrate-binding subunit